MCCCLLFVFVKDAYIYLVYIFLYALSLSSPYLLVFGDDRVRGTREQVMIQVELVRLSYREGLIMGDFYVHVFGNSIFNI